MSEKFDLSQIRSYWTEQATRHGLSSSASWSDQHAIDLECRQLLHWIDNGDKVLDIGCANGYTAAQLASERDIHISGIDYIPEMIAEARQRMQQMPRELAEKMHFSVGDIRQLDVVEASYDKVVVVRTVINLNDWETQCQALDQAISVVRKGGLLLLSEATLQGWEKLNLLRNEWGLPDIPEPAFNRYLDEEKVARHLAKRAELLEVVNFSSSYFVGTRVIKPLLAQLLGMDSHIANPDMEWNRWFSMMPAAGDYGTQKLFVFRKR